ncbi:dTDP-4-dehydrorhamnose reductase [Acetobacteraceae bacterium]|nr:dTDP-4-dehydrorhamnose reductase [Acetobacteraceae bacterium]
MPKNTPILIIGHDGQVATSLRHEAEKNALNLVAIGRSSLNLATATQEELSALFEKIQPWAVINAAAFTQVDLAETQHAEAQAINQKGVALLSQECAKRDLPFLHISTDYVFDGSKGSPYFETDPVAPLGIYGKTKEAGEKEALKYKKSIILRTSWVYSAYGKNFVKTILHAAKTRPVLKVVNDQKGNPTSAPALAEILLAILKNIQENGWKAQYHGIFHATGSGETTWYGFTEFLLSEREKHGLSIPELLPVSTAEYPTPAKRPADSRLSCQKLKEVFDLSLPCWKKSCAEIALEILRPELEIKTS